MYPTSSKVSALGFQLNEVVPKLIKEEQGYGEFRVYINLFEDKSYSKPLVASDYPYEVTVEDRLYFEVKLDTDDKRLVVFAENCSVTPTDKLDDPRKYYLTKSGYVDIRYRLFMYQPK